jgi:hypothetical protein
MGGFDEEEQANEELALTEICGLEEFEVVPEKHLENFKKSFGTEKANVKGAFLID